MKNKEPTGDGQKPYTKRDKIVAAQIADNHLPQSEPPLNKLAVRAASVAIDRWGTSLEQDDQEYTDFEDVLEQTVVDTLRQYEHEGEHIDGVTELVFKGNPISSSKLFAAALEMAEAVEEGCKVNRNDPGGLI